MVGLLNKFFFFLMKLKKFFDVDSVEVWNFDINLIRELESFLMVFFFVLMSKI